MGIIPDNDGGSIRLEGVEFMHPCGRFRKLVRKDVRDLRLWIRSNALARGTGEAVTNGIMEEVIGI